ncbi:PREDICTED: E3 ubiquitin-protein ligase FANCL-like [Elephantulus edwardii]|uniref:E3 ubiquitin-protein ligase FANCL-like n=1 Tax=Elephantulus edwardii TaxID=28737 RepID=UPI0003F08262|nr:PREDICTED: E3 ubiquitin-protein ligase FANCL-like [Elephantulus edwardii]
MADSTTLHMVLLDFYFRPPRARDFFPPRRGLPPLRPGSAWDCACAAPLPNSQGCCGGRARADMEGSLLRLCPLLLPQNREKTIYEGFISAQGRDFHLKIMLPEDLQVKKARLLCSWQLRTILNGYHQIIEQRMQHSPDLTSFMMELKMILEVALKNKQEMHRPPPPQFYSRLVEELGTLGWDKLVYVDPSFCTIKLTAKDASGREHHITLKLTAKYPEEAPDCLVDFPVPFPVSWTPQSSLESIHSQFLAALDSLKAFWDAMDEIDEKTWVLEPENPTRSATARRIALGNNASVNIDVDPRHPTMPPECYFLGADHVIKPLGIKLSKNIHLWDPENTPLQNLKDVLEIDFPARSILEKSDFTMDCGICYAFQLDGAIPDQVCDNPQCGQPFHQICLYEWLRGLLTSRQSFNIIFGECPYCSKPITLKMAGRKP